MVSLPSVSALAATGYRPSAAQIWFTDGGLIASRRGLLLTDRAVLRPDVSPKNIRHRWQIIECDDNQTIVATFRSRAAAELFLYSGTLGVAVATRTFLNG